MADRLETTLINGRPLRYRIKRNRQTRKLGVRVCRHDGVVVTLPLRVGLSVVPEILREWSDWIEEKADRYGVRNGPVLKQYGSGSRIPILGRDRVLDVAPLPSSRSRPVWKLTPDTLELRLAPGDILDLRPALEKTLRKLARQELEVRTATWAEAVGRKPGKIIVGQRTSRWGSCSPRGTLSFCWRLVLAPAEVMDAVVAHEACHLVHLNHGPRFHRLLDRIMPGNGEAMRWLRRHEDDLIY